LALPSKQNRQTSGPCRERPQYLHMAIGVMVVAFFDYSLLHPLRTLLTEIIGQALSLAQIQIEKAWTLEGPALAMRLLDETELLIVMTWQRSGFLSITIFSLLFVLLTFPLKGPLWCKIAWLGLGNLVGLAWNLLRLFLLVMAAYYLGAGAFKVVDFVTGPAIDFLWVVPVWSLGLSLLVSAERRKGTKGGK